LLYEFKGDSDSCVSSIHRNGGDRCSRWGGRVHAGAWDQSASSEWGPSASTQAGLDAVQEPSMVPNIDGSMSTPGSPGAI
jgi:hypothetical protein